MSDVGEHSVVGAGAVVTKALPAQVVAAGVPARVIRSRVEEDRSTQEMQT
jgi:acetyltransferase-like isoleucine patch superfamily enzyme